MRETLLFLEFPLLPYKTAAVRTAFAVCALTVLSSFAHSQTKDGAMPQVTYVKAGHLFDATSDSLRDNMVLVIEGERISKVAAAGEIQIPGDARVVDLSKAWVLPGLIDCHVHLESQGSGKDGMLNTFTLTDADVAYNAAIYAKRTLMAGFTTVRDLGGSGVNISLRKAVQKGLITADQASRMSEREISKRRR